MEFTKQEIEDQAAVKAFATLAEKRANLKKELERAHSEMNQILGALNLVDALIDEKSKEIAAIEQYLNKEKKENVSTPSKSLE